MARRGRSEGSPPCRRRDAPRWCACSTAWMAEPPRCRRDAPQSGRPESDALPLRQSVKCIKCIRWGSNPRLRRDWGLNPTPSWLIVDERPTRPRIQMCRKDFVRDSDRVRTRIDLVRIDPATLAGVDFKSTALTTRPHYRRVQSASKTDAGVEPATFRFPVRPDRGVSRRRRRADAPRYRATTPTGLEPATPRFEV